MQLAKYIKENVFEVMGGKITIPAKNRLLTSNTNFNYVIGNYYLVCIINNNYHAMPIGYTEQKAELLELSTQDASVSISKDKVNIVNKTASAEISESAIKLDLAGISLEITNSGINFNTSGKFVTINNKQILVNTASLVSGSPGSTVTIANSGQP